MRMTIAKLIWKLHDWLDDPLNRLGCYIAWGKNWRDKSDW